MAALILVGLAAAFCIVRSLIDFRNKSYGWSALGLVIGVGLLFAPMGTTSHTVTVNLPTEPQ